jgi:hypothetical protein
MMMTEMDIGTSVYYVHLTRLIAREDYIKFTRREIAKTYIVILYTFSTARTLSLYRLFRLQMNTDTCKRLL